MPAASASVPVSTRSMSARPAACIALILPGSCGAGAFVNVTFETRFGFFSLNASMAFCVSCRLPATSTTFSDTGAATAAAADNVKPSATAMRRTILVVFMSPLCGQWMGPFFREIMTALYDVGQQKTVTIGTGISLTKSFNETASGRGIGSVRPAC